jgi:hypothetical protein
LISVSLWTLKEIFIDRAWPTYLAYYAIAVALLLIVVQMRLARRTADARTTPAG